MRPDTRMNGDAREAPVPDDFWDNPEDSVSVPENAYDPARTPENVPAWGGPAPDQSAGRNMEIPEDWGSEPVYPDAVYEQENAERRNSRPAQNMRRARIAGERTAASDSGKAPGNGMIPEDWGDSGEEPGMTAYDAHDPYHLPVGWGVDPQNPSGHARLRPVGSRGRQGDRPHARIRGEQEGPSAAGPNTPIQTVHPGKRINRLPWILVSIFCVLMLLFLGGWLINLYFFSGEPVHRARVAAVYGNVFPAGMTVDGVAIGGMTLTEAEAALKPDHAETVPQVDITITIRGGNSYHVTNDQIPFYRNTAAVLNEALNLTRQGMADTLLSPVEYRQKKAKQIASTGAYYYTRITYSKGNVQQLVRAIGEAESEAAADATILAFDFSTRTFSFTAERVGRSIDTEALYEGLTGMLENGQYTGELILEPTVIQPAVTRTTLMNTFTMIASYSTKMSSDPARNMNIARVCEALNRTVLGSGESFSFNACTGERTSERGYLVTGGSADAPDGGVCQVSGTLLNAAALADMTITARSAYAQPGENFEMGREAAVSWPDQDLCFRNDKGYPVFIVADCSGQNCTVEFYGIAPSAGEMTELMTVVTAREDPPAEPEYIVNSSLPGGAQRTVRNAGTGYTVETYRVYKLNGVEYRRTKLFESVYGMTRQLIEYNQ